VTEDPFHASGCSRSVGYRRRRSKHPSAWLPWLSPAGAAELPAALQSITRGNSPARTSHVLWRVLLCLGLALSLSSAWAGRSTRAADLPVLRWAEEGIRDLATLDPAAIGDWNGRLAAGFIFEGLVRQAPDGTVTGAAAESWSVSKDGRVYTFRLRAGLRFGDGTPVSAGDLVYSIDRALSPPFQHTANTYVLGVIMGAADRSTGRSRTLAGVQAVGDRLVRITLTAPCGSFLARLGLPAAAIVSRRLIARDGARWTDHAVGIGPFIVKSWQHNQALELAPNPYYYGPRPRIDISLAFVPELTTAFKQFQLGALDVMGTVAFPPDQAYRAEGDPQFHRSPRPATTYLMLNVRRAPLSSDLVREALAHALDKPSLVRAVFGELAQPTDGMVPPGIPGHSTRISGVGYDPVLARKLLAQAGYPGGRRFPGLVFSADEGAQNLKLATAVVEQWHAVLGIDAKIAQAEHNAYNLLLTSLAFQIASIAWTMDWPDPQNFLTQLLRTGSPNNNGGWSNRQFDRLVDSADRLVGYSAERLSLYQHAEAIAMRQAATIPLANPQAGIMIRTGVKGLLVTSGNVVVPNWSDVHIEPGT
jgi:oligopeptide transport system substrate-binding protein